MDDLRSRAEELAVGFECTGHIPDSELPRYLRAVDVPIAPAAQVSASASINSWITAGRRPLVMDGRYSRELEAINPGAESADIAPAGCERRSTLP